MSRRAIVILTVLIIIPVAFLFIDVLDNVYTIDIERKAGTDKEMEAIRAVEECDLESLTNASRFHRWDDDVEPPSNKPKAFVWARLVDEETLCYYRWKVNALKEDWEDVRVSMEYDAHCTRVEGLEVNAYHLEGPDRDIYCVRSRNATIKHRGWAGFLNLSGLSEMDGWYSIGTAYVVEQHFDYNEYYGPLHAFLSSVDQMAILDENHNLLAIVCIWRGGMA